MKSRKLRELPYFNLPIGLDNSSTNHFMGGCHKQMQVGFATTEDGGVPFWHRPFSGNAAEISQVADVMENLKRLVKPSSFTLVGDSLNYVKPTD